jgi:GT2 family glycosyltransferase/glycosyltransferase involved in cell wall biosynthesis
VIVPVFAGLSETLACLTSVLDAANPAMAELIVIDDASPDPDLKRALEALAAAGRITLLVNAENRGFPASVNRGIAAAGDRDVVLLNADAQVFGDWLSRLTRAARAAPDVATVSPVSNHGAMLAYPAGDETDLGADGSAALDALLARLNPGRALELPSGAGFCLYISRACLDEVGAFDEAAFGPGYGEENDFCLRASALGWRHLGALDVFVRHAGGVSFGPLKRLLTERNQAVLAARHPAWRAAIEGFLTADPFAPERAAIDRARLAAAAPALPVLIITLGRGGGVARHVADRAEALAAEGWRVIQLAPAGRLTVVGEPFQDLTFRLPDDFDDLADFLAGLGIRRVEIHHILGLDPVVLSLPGRLGVPFDLHVHDYSWICPRITLIAGDARYCGEPDLAACETCVTTHGSLIEEDISVAALRVRSARLIAAAARVIVPTVEVARRLARYFPDAQTTVTPWEDEPLPAPDFPAPRPPDAPVRVAMLGAIGEHKGFARLLACARDAAARNLPIEYVVVGHGEDDPALFATGRVFVTGPYAEDEAAELLSREACDVALIPSVWPETWCYAATHLLRSGLPLIAYDLGAVGLRLAGLERARLLPLETDAAELNAALIAAGSAPRAVVETKVSDRGEGWITAFRVGLAGRASSALDYAARPAGGDWLAWTPAPAWLANGARPLVGVAARLTGPLADTHSLTCAARFASGAVAAGKLCQPPNPNDPLVALEIRLDARHGFR